MKKHIKLGFTDTNNQIARFFVSVLSQRFEITVDNENPDYLIFGDRNFGENNLRYDPNKVTKIFYTGENQRPWDYQCHFAISFDHVENDVMYRLPLYVVYNLDNMFNNIPSVSTHTRSLDDISEKTEFCSFVVRNPNCEKRNVFFEKMCKYKTVASGGPLFNNIGYVLPHGDECMRSKLAWLPKHKFNICFENSSYPGYVTEKLYEAYIGNTIPIYWGSSTVEVDFNPRAFLNWHDYGSDEALIEAVIELDQNEDRYKEMYMQPLFSKQSMNRFMDLNRLANWFETYIYKG